LRAIIFANGQLPEPGAGPVIVASGDLVIAADGGSHACRAWGLVPHAVVGDLDSLSTAEVAALAAAGAEIVSYPARKDFTDLDLALQYARDRGADEILVHGALGARWDQTLANMLLAVAPHLAGTRIGLVDGPQTLWPLRAGETLTLRGQPGDTVSLLPLAGDAVGVTTDGLDYPLRGETLAFGTTRGVSNVLVAEEATISLDQGALICVHIRQGALP